MYLNTILRVLVGFVFAFSGFVKAVDPQGTEIKILDYLQAFGLGPMFPAWFPLVGSILLSSFESLIGVCLLTGSFKRMSAILAFCFMMAMTPLTLWLAIDNPVSDCGCFGDAVALTNWQTFWKNVFLLLCILLLVWIYLKNPDDGSKMRWIAPISALCVVVFLQTYALRHLPIIDFRPYKVGADIRAGMQVPEDAKRPVYRSALVFERNGEQRVFSLDNYPDSTWTYVRTEVQLLEAGYVPPIHDFVIVSASSHTDVTEKVLSAEHVFLVLSADIKKAGINCASPINSLYNRCLSDDVGFYFITPSSEDAFSEWSNATHAGYPIYQMDATTVKTIVRSNPGIVELRKGVVVGKWNACDYK